MQPPHLPVLLDEVLGFLAPVDGGIYVDANLGFGGHAEKILEESAPAGRVIGFDCDAHALESARQNLSRFGGRVTYVHRNFSSLKETLHGLGIDRIDGLLLDLGVSSWQLDASGRGFSFKGSEPLDMRMDERASLTAAELLNTATEDELADIFYFFGEERQARRVAKYLVAERQKNRIENTDQLTSVVERAIPKKFHPKKVHVATKIFQALRIAVNRELENLSRILADGPSLLASGGKFCVISFHSLEDRLVKRAFLENPSLRVLTKKPVVPSSTECRRNPRARSAKLRVAEAAEGEKL